MITTNNRGTSKGGRPARNHRRLNAIFRKKIVKTDDQGNISVRLLGSRRLYPNRTYEEYQAEVLFPACASHKLLKKPKQESGTLERVMTEEDRKQATSNLLESLNLK
tara:strand:+ start:904 stop:1224 length:321 start_codon:yes stop_codon:yes gene_type:complete